MTALLTEPEQLRELLGIPFTREQLCAVAAEPAPAVIVAGAGSGKTSVMAARVVWLVGSGQVAPERVLGLTFTAKASGELASRITGALEKAELVGPKAAAVDADGVLVEPGLPTVSTYHAFAGRLFTEHALRLGLEPSSRLLADATRFQLAARVLRRHRGELRRLTSPLRMLIGELVALEGELSEHLGSAGDLLRFDERFRAEVEQALELQPLQHGNKGHRDLLATMLEQTEKRDELAVLAGELREAKRRANLIDFADQVAFGARLAREHPAVGEAEREAAHVVLLDEYQDTSVAQREMLVGLFGGGHPVTAVGDPCQAIYGWRGASVSNLDGFPGHFPRADGGPAKVYSLAVNQRSGGRLLGLANRLTDPLREKHDVVELSPPAGREQLGRTVLALHETYEAECAWMAGQVRAAVEAGVPPGECAVLVRVRSDFPAMRDALAAAGLPVEVVGLGGLLSLPEVRDLVSTLEVLNDPTANAALVRLVAGPRWRLGMRDIAALGARARELVREGTTASRAAREEKDHDDLLVEAAEAADPADLVSLAEALTSPGSRMSAEGAERARLLGEELRRLRRHLSEPLLDFVHRVLRATGLGLEVALADAGDGGRRRAVLDAFLDVVAGFADLEGQSSLAAFLAFLDAAEEHDRGLDLSTPSGADAVQVMTVHKAKGLEWDVVAVPNMTDGVFPVDDLRDRRWMRTAKQLPVELRGDSDDLDDLARSLTKEDAKAYDEACRGALELDERRLGYVAVTRARHTLIASSHWWGPTQKKKRGPSPFLLQLQGLVDEDEIAVWDPEPAAKTNPHLSGPLDLAWPAPAEPVALARRQTAAAAVRAGLAVLDPLGASDAPAPEPAGELSPADAALFAELDQEAELLLEAERRNRAVVRDVELPAQVSASQLLLLQSDPAALARQLARPLPRRPVTAARRGTRFHAWVESLWDQAALLETDELPGAEDSDFGDETLESLQRAFLAGEYAHRRPVALEAPFSLPIAGRVVVGRIDAVYALPGDRVEVVDWKTGSETADPLQLAIYRMAWAALTGRALEDVDAAFVYVAKGIVARPDLPTVEEVERLLGG